MDIKQLKEIINKVPERYNNLKLKIITNDSGVGGTSCVGVKWFKQGMDWDINYFLIKPDINLIKEEQNG